jgi:hypothetical protein
MIIKNVDPLPVTGEQVYLSTNYPKHPSAKTNFYVPQAVFFTPIFSRYQCCCKRSI